MKLPHHVLPSRPRTLEYMLRYDLAQVYAGAGASPVDVVSPENEFDEEILRLFFPFFLTI